MQLHSENNWRGQQKRSGIMLCYPLEEKRFLKWGVPVMLQPKLDGQRCRAVWNAELEGWELFSSQLTLIKTLPHINFLLEEANFPHSMELDGELYTPGLSLQEIGSLVRSSVNQKDASEIQYNIFDQVSIRDNLFRYSELEESIEWLDFPETLRLVPIKLASSWDEIMTTYKKHISKGLEGIIVRHPFAPYIRRRSIFMMKFKPKKMDWYQIVGWKQLRDRFGDLREELGSFLCQGDDGETFSVGTGYDEKDRKRFWQMIQDDPEEMKRRQIRVEYQHLSPGRKVPIVGVYVSLVDKY